MRLLLTGATGFLGSRLLFLQEDHNVGVLGRTRPKGFVGGYFSASLGEGVDCSLALCGVDVVVHCAARAHIMKDESVDPLTEYRRVNVDGTLNLARQAAQAGVKRFIYISSIKVNGEETVGGKRFCADDQHAPEDPYGLSKSEAEQQLFALGRETRMEIVVIRPPLVYGPGVKANFASLMKLVSKGLPLPFSCINGNRRSLVSLTNLVDLIVTCIEHPKATNQIFLVSDNEDLSTASLVKGLAKALDVSSLQLPVPLWCYRLAGKIFGREDTVNRLLGSLQVDISHTKKTLEWTPPQSVADGLRETAEYFLRGKR